MLGIIGSLCASTAGKEGMCLSGRSCECLDRLRSNASGLLMRHCPLAGTPRPSLLYHLTTPVHGTTSEGAYSSLFRPSLSGADRAVSFSGSSSTPQLPSPPSSPSSHHSLFLPPLLLLPSQQSLTRRNYQPTSPSSSSRMRPQTKEARRVKKRLRYVYFSLFVDIVNASADCTRPPRSSSAR